MRHSRIAFLVLTMFAVALSGCDSGEKAPACATDDDCPIGSVCENGECKEPGCSEEYEPVCGVDGQTYGNACEARKAHVEIASQGECPQPCGGIDGEPCPEGSFCEIPAGLCDTADAEGMCVQIPQACTDHVAPVCGCDGQTYSNDCYRQVAAVSKNHDGECRE